MFFNYTYCILQNYKAHGNGACDVTVSGCSGSAAIKAKGTSYAGGIVGRDCYGCNVIDCVNAGTVTADTAATCPTLFADLWVFNADGSITLKAFAAKPVEPEVTEPDKTESTGDYSIVFAALALISVAGVAVASKKKEY